MNPAEIIKMIEESGVEIPTSVKQKALENRTPKQKYQEILTFIEGVVQNESFEDLTENPNKTLLDLLLYVVALLICNGEVIDTLEVLFSTEEDEKLTEVVGLLPQLENKDLVKLVLQMMKTPQFKRTRKTKEEVKPAEEKTIEEIPCPFPEEK